MRKKHRRIPGQSVVAMTNTRSRDFIVLISILDHQVLASRLRRNFWERSAIASVNVFAKQIHRSLPNRAGVVVSVAGDPKGSNDRNPPGRAAP